MICGGTLVTDGNALRVITAAHCLSGIRPDTYRIVFGLHLRSQQNSNLNTIVQRSPTNVVPHSGYSSNTLSNDIAVFGFGSSFTMDTLAGTFASPACLPDVLHTTNEVGIVSGWGTIREGTSTYRDPLQFVTKNLMTNAECEQTGNKGQIDSTMLCAGDVGIDACQGDSGGPLVVNRNGRYTLVGMYSIFLKFPVFIRLYIGFLIRRGFCGIACSQ
ncbi:chymotrypsin B-like [Ruditapes philippinarum]|uniref:chymotrypsin B-like n=1 Tax=Ruditapes philippinarum TaxID=129788 RepID=UPI00295C2805|nr:chymotrypsin B-like [Ruditapes philippinarum]